MNVVFTPTAWQQYTDWQKEDKKILVTIKVICKSVFVRYPSATYFPIL